MVNRISCQTPALVTLLDAEKTFDPLEWPFLKEALIKLGIPTALISLVMLLYPNPVARMGVNGSLNDPLICHLLERHIHEAPALHFLKYFRPESRWV